MNRKAWLLIGLVLTFSGVRTWSCMVEPLPLPAPTDLHRTAYTQAPKSISLAWTDNSSDETGFQIEISSDGGVVWTIWASVSVNTTAHTATVAADPLLYIFRVRAVRSTDSIISDPSNVVSVEGTDPVITDTDGDLMLDLFELTNGLNPYRKDGTEDADGDRYPNVVEYLRNGDVQDPEVHPAADIVVDIQGGGDFTDLQSAIDAATLDYTIIQIKAGVYPVTEPLEINGVSIPPLLILSETGAKDVILDGGKAVSILGISESDSVIDGLTFRNGNSTYGGGAAVVVFCDPLFNNCVFLGNKSTVPGGALIFVGSAGKVLHSTFLNNDADDEGKSIYAVFNSEVWIGKSIFWSTDHPTASELSLDGSTLTVDTSIVRGGYAGTDNSAADPLLTADGHLTALSPAINMGGLISPYGLDMDGEERPFGSSTEPGADEFIDSDTNGLPDWWEMLEFGHIGVNPNLDGDGDSLNNAEEYKRSSDPSNYYSQGGDLILPSIQIVSGDEQEGLPGEFAALPLVVNVRNGAFGELLVNAPVTFTVTKGDGKMALVNSGAPQTYLVKELRTDAEGQASLYFQNCSHPGEKHAVRVHADDDPVWFSLKTSGPAVTSGADTDLDGMNDAYETANGLNPAVDDAMDDLDGDRIPNLFEFKHGTAANDANVRPAADFTVDPANGDNDPDDTIFKTIAEAVYQLNDYEFDYETYEYSYPNDFAVIEVKSGVYLENITLQRPVVLLGETGGSHGPVEIRGISTSESYALQIPSQSVIDGFILSHAYGKKGGGLYTYAYAYDEEPTQRRLINCIIRANESIYGGGIYNAGADLDLIHCTITGNKGIYSGRAVYNSSGTINLINSIVWGNTGTAAEEVYKYTGDTINASTSIVAGGEQGGINQNPNLTPGACLKSNSAAINRSGIALKVTYDIHGEPRPVGATSDLGADEYKDNNGTTDGDGLPDWAEGADDDDGLTALDEYLLHGTDPLAADSDGDGVNDGIEVAAGTNPLLKDSDQDGMDDAYEAANGLNSLVDDGLEDADGDRVPNIFEFKRGTLANDVNSRPAATFVVDPATGGSSPNDNVFSSLREAIQRVNDYEYDYQTGQYVYPNEFAVIEVKSGIYEEKVLIERAVALLADLDPGALPVEIRTSSANGENYALDLRAPSVVDGFVIGHEKNRTGSGLYSYYNGYSTESSRRRMVNCVIKGNEASYGGGVYNYGSILDLVHCTITGNKGASYGRGVYNSSGTINLINSIVWGNTGSAAQEVYKYTGQNVNASTSIVAGGEQGGINQSPFLTPGGWLKSGSSAINRNGVILKVAYDIHGELRPAGSTPDLGADEYKDTNGVGDGDGLPDWLEGSDDNDGLTALDEYQIHGTNPLEADSDGDGVNDGAEVTAGTNPLLRDSDQDGMDDGYEVANGLNTSVDDGLEDRDGDRVPNLFEFKRGTLANDVNSRPAATFVVDPATGENSPTDNVFSRIQEAIQQVNRSDYNSQTGQYSYPNEFAIVEVKSGVYEEVIALERPTALLAERGGAKGPVEIRGSVRNEYTLKLYSMSVVDGFVLSHLSGYEGGGVYASNYYSSASLRRRLVNCVIRGNKADYGPGLHNYNAEVELVHCTITGNEGNGDGRAIYSSYGTVKVANSIVWGNTGVGASEISHYGAVITVSSSIVSGGEYAGIDQDPELTPAGWLKSTSAAIDRAGVPLRADVPRDIQGELRPVGTTADLGADEYKDNNGSADGDGVPDWVEGADDGDGISASDEYQAGLNPLSSDTDNDGLGDGEESVYGTDPLSSDSDNDGIKDGTEEALGTDPLSADSDGDGLYDGEEVDNFTDPLLADTDDDGMDDHWEITWGTDPLVDDSLLDPDHDGLGNLVEFQAGTEPWRFDSDGDGMSDGFEHSSALLDPQVYNNPDSDVDSDGMSDIFEAIYGFDPDVDDGAGDLDLDGLSNLREFEIGSSPQLKDTDGDGLTDFQEEALGTDPWNYDSDGDGLSDFFENQHGLDPLINQPVTTDKDNDGLKDVDEAQFGTDPNLPDTDGDGVSDGDETTIGSDPNDGSDGGLAPPPEMMMEVTFSVGAEGKEVKASCAVCHHPQVMLNKRLLGVDEVVTIRKDKIYDLSVKDKPETWRPAGQEPPHDTTAKFTVWPKASPQQTMEVSSDKKLFKLNRDEVLQFIITNNDEMFAENKDWDSAVLSKTEKLVPVEIKEVYEKDQVWNKAPSPKRPTYDILSKGGKPEEHYNRLYVTTELQSGKAELMVKLPFAIPAGSTEKLLACAQDEETIIQEFAVFNAEGLAELKFSPTGSINEKTYKIRIGFDKNADGKLTADELVALSKEPDVFPFTVKVARVVDIREAYIKLPGVGLPGTFLRYFKGEDATLFQSAANPNKTYQIGEDPPTMIAGSVYDQGDGSTEIPSFSLVDGTNASNAIEERFCYDAKLGLYSTAIDIWRAHTADFIAAFVDPAVTEPAAFTYTIAPKKGISFYYPGNDATRLTYGGAWYKSGSISFKLHRVGSKILVKEITINAIIEDVYDFDFTRPPGSASRKAATIQIGHQPPGRIAGRIFQTETQIQVLYNAASDYGNFGKPIEFFNNHAYIDGGTVQEPTPTPTPTPTPASGGGIQ